MDKVKADDIIILYDSEKKKRYFLNLKLSRGKFGTDRGEIQLASIIGADYGSTVKTHLGYSYVILPMNIFDFVMFKLNRLTQIVYPKDAAYIILKLNVKPGDTVIESGIGSGAMTSIFAHFVGDSGRVISYEKRPEFIRNAVSNLRKVNLDKRVTVKCRDISQGFDEKNADAVFLDVREPHLYVESAYKALKPGNTIGILVPTANQVIDTLKIIEKLPFLDIEVSELLLRKYKIVPERFRPEDRMVAHTAYLMFAKKADGF